MTFDPLNQVSPSLKKFNTFAIDCSCAELQIVSTTIELVDTVKKAFKSTKPFLVLGGGSNVLFTQNFAGKVIIIETKGIELQQDDNFYYLSVAAGENWHALVNYCLENNMPGLENMALIPGTVGAAPIQNIGAYGLEFCRVCNWVKYLDLETEEIETLSVNECLFDYRDSIFKSELKNKAIITEVGIKLSKKWQPVISYGSLQNFDLATVSAKDIFDRVCDLRTHKLPNPNILGNAGSFFKNPIIDANLYMTLAQKFPNIVGYALADGNIKLAAGWLIEHAGLKGFTLGGACVHKEQALVLVNLGDASGSDICHLAQYVIQQIKQKFSVILEPEPRIFGQLAEINISDF